MSYYKPIGNPAELQKRLPQNPKFATVTSTLDTGASQTVMKRLHEYDVSTKPNPGENFKRMHPASLARYIEFVQQQQQRAQAAAAGAEVHDDIYAGDVFAGVMPALQAQNAPQKQILLLDVREQEDYLKCHIALAQSFHYTRLNRSTNVWTAEIMKAINKDDWMILLYDLQEEIVSKPLNIGNVVFEKGVNNVWILSGGMKEFAQRASSLLVGECPVPILPRPNLPDRATVLSTCHRASKAAAGGAAAAAAAGTQRTSGSKYGIDGNESTVSRVSIASSSRPKALASSLARRASSATKQWH